MDESENILDTISDFRRIHQMIEENENQIKELRLKNQELKKILEGEKKEILEFMEEEEQDIIHVSGVGEFQKKESKKKKTLGKKEILEIIYKYITDTEILDKIENDMKNRPVSKETKLFFKR